jgi:uncharacterized protein
MRILLFMTLFTFVFILLNFYISKRFIAKVDLSEKIKRYFNLFLLINFFGILGYIYTRYNPDVPNLLYFLFSIPIGVVFLLFCTAVIYDISRVAIDKVPLKPNRRFFFKKSLDLAALGAGVLLSGRALYEAKHLVIEDVDIKIKNLVQQYNIVQLSDLHIGGLIDQEYIAGMVNKVNVLNPDLVVITGDLVDIKVDHAKKALEEFKKLQSKYGTYFIVGNHEYFHDIEKIIDVVKTMGIKVLENENIYIGEKNKGFNLAGVYDWFGYRAEKFQPDIKKALFNKDKNSPTILLAHQPRFIEEVKGGVDLILSGHTHGGQLYPFRFLVKLVQPYISGLHRHNKELQIYVNRGSGFWGPPMRLGSRAEITNITIS